MARQGKRRGPELPYELLCGVVPTRRGWLVTGGKLVGVGLFPEEPVIYPELREILDHVPGYSVIALAIPIGLPDRRKAGGRQCEREARRLLGWPRMGAVLPSPTRAAARATNKDDAKRLNGGHLSPATWGQRRHIKEAMQEIQPHHQRYVYEVHPELCFYQLNDDRPMAYSKHSELGYKERAELILKRMPGAEKYLDVQLVGVKPVQILDGLAGLWSSRRIVAKAATRMPEDPVWDSQGLRMEFVR